ncbi:glycine zipper domain-containing protein [Desulfogranum marinum]|uniref:glycine zipper domain-containing protein n=1 Tax=Desulfogranum marinum TaxID=453220 RepID=UPI0029C7C57A|nr:glycine zipper domain-containing protein [Desulfogranum marinum]
MGKMFKSTVLLVILGCCPVVAVCEAELMVFPAKGQTPQQQSADEQECRNWAINQSGVDPARLSAPASSANQQNSRPVLRGAAKGAAVGGLGGSLGGEFGKGAAAGAAVGGLVGGMQNRRQQQATATTDQQAQQIYNQQIDSYNRAYSACLEGKGYTVK